MPIVAECASCGKKYRFNNDQAGERVPCRACGANIRVPGARCERSSSRSGVSPALIGGFIGFVVLALIGSAVFMRDPPAPVVQQPAIPQASPEIATSSTDQTPSRPTRLNSSSENAANSSSPAVSSRPARTVNSTAPLFAPTATTKITQPMKAVLQDGWRVAVDAPAEMRTLSQSRIQLPLPTFAYVAAPQIASPFVATRGWSPGNTTTTITVFNLETLKAGKPLSARGFAQSCPITISPDGKRVALISNKSLSEWSADTGKLIKATITEFPESGRLFEYTSPTRIVVSYEHDIAVYDMSTPKADSVLIPTEEDRQASFALSPGGNFVAGYFPQKKLLTVFDLNAGKLAGEISFSSETRAGNCSGLSFAPDGKELAVLFNSGNGVVLINFDVTSGSVLHQYEPQIGFQFNWGGRNGQKQDIQFLPNNRGWALFARHVIDRNSGEILWSNNQENSILSEMPWKVLPNDRLLVKSGDALRSIDISREALAVKSQLMDAKPAAQSTDRLVKMERDAGKTTPLPRALISWQKISDPGTASEEISGKAVVGYSDGGWRAQLFPDRRHLLFTATETTSVLAGADINYARIFRARVVDLKTGEILRELQPPIPLSMIEADFPKIGLAHVLRALDEERTLRREEIEDDPIESSAAVQRGVQAGSGAVGGVAGVVSGGSRAATGRVREPVTQVATAIRRNGRFSHGGHSAADGSGS